MTSHVTRWYFGVEVRNNYSLTKHSYPNPSRSAAGVLCVETGEKGASFDSNFKPCSPNGSLWTDVK